MLLFPLFVDFQRKVIFTDEKDRRVTDVYPLFHPNPWKGLGLGFQTN